MKLRGYLCALCCALGLSVAQAGPLSGATVSGTYSDGALILAPSSPVVWDAEFYSENGAGELWFGIDFHEDGTVDFSSLMPGVSPANQIFTFDFTGISQVLAGVAIDFGTITLIDADSFSVDLSGLQMTDDFGVFATAQLSFRDPAAQVPLPGTLLLVGAGLGLLGLRRRS
ncbi:PEP-CTERM sorting domain-containing protein [Uliginosibacterium sp. H1]|uniref:PEP-CTERM sorting domain-containing protein n=1 Tax=Uliginosibacterium sp. H1 TaxID=3114757 RepID=UPI002E18F315|nr:PEP-CTERM sorting domain-containing protein [Uliginosibacterium sp. H1]